MASWSDRLLGGRVRLVLAVERLSGRFRVFRLEPGASKRSRSLADRGTMDRVVVVDLEVAVHCRFPVRLASSVASSVPVMSGESFANLTFEGYYTHVYGIRVNSIAPEFIGAGGCSVLPGSRDTRVAQQRVTPRRDRLGGQRGGVRDVPGVGRGGVHLPARTMVMDGGVINSVLM